MTGKPLYRGVRQEAANKVQSQNNDNMDDFISNLSAPARKPVTQTSLPDVSFDTSRHDNTVIDESDDVASDSGVTVVGNNDSVVDDDFDDMELFSSSKRHKGKKSDTSQIESVSFNNKVNSPDIAIDDSDEVVDSGVKVVGQRKEDVDDDIIINSTPVQRPVVKTSTNAASAKFKVGNAGPSYNVDTSDEAVVQAGVQKVGASNVDVEDDDDEFEAAFVKKDYRRRQSSSHGDIGLLPTFDDITIAETDSGTSDVVDDDDDDLDLSMDPAFMTPVAPGGQPKVIEKVVERVVEKPVEIIKEVEKRVEVPVERVVEKEVVKEKTVFVSGGSSQAHTFKQIMSKKEPVYLLVTGDRRSGVTTTALSFANIFGSQMKTLYVDLDTETHGSVIRLGIMDIIEEPDSIQEGLKNLRNPKGLKHLVYWGNNKFASLISNFDTDITDEEITRATNALAVQQDFDLVVIDCPFSKLGLLDDILPECDTIVCMDGSAQSVINTMSLFTDLTKMGVSKKVQNMMFRSARVLITERGIKAKEVKENMEFVNDIFKLTDEPIPWINTPVMGFMDNFVKAVKNM